MAFPDVGFIPPGQHLVIPRDCSGQHFKRNTMQKVIVALLLVVFGICTTTLYLMWRNQGQMVLVPAMMEEIIYPDPIAEQDYRLN